MASPENFEQNEKSSSPPNIVTDEILIKALQLANESNEQRDVAGLNILLRRWRSQEARRLGNVPDAYAQVYRREAQLMAKAGMINLAYAHLLKAAEYIEYGPELPAAEFQRQLNLLDNATKELVVNGAVFANTSDIERDMENADTGVFQPKIKQRKVGDREAKE